ncbi:MAG: hypothetical protein ACI3V0_08545 [Faecousia sp.]
MWIESHQQLANHPKLKRLARLLGVSKQAAIGYLHLLWWWALDYAPQGQIIPPFDTEDVADAVEFDGEPCEIVNALVDSGFLDRNDETLTIHDWYDYAGKLLDKRESDRARKAAQRKKSKENGK